MLNVHLIRSNEYDLSSYWEVISTLQAFDGPITFIAHEEDVEIDDEALKEEVVGDDDFYKSDPIKEEDLMSAPILKSEAYRDLSYIPKEELIVIRKIEVWKK